MFYLCFREKSSDISSNNMKIYIKTKIYIKSLHRYKKLFHFFLTVIKKIKYFCKYKLITVNLLNCHFT